jgi:hypothetical protein
MLCTMYLANCSKIDPTKQKHHVLYKISFCISECCTINDVFSFDAYMHHLGHKVWL